MSLSDLAAIGSFISGFAVLISLVFLYFQLRQVTEQVMQAERNQMAAIRQGRTANLVEMQTAAMEPSVANAIPKGMAGADDISRTEFYQFRSFCGASFAVGEDAFYQHKDGLLSEAAFDSSFANTRAGLTAPGFRVAWRKSRIRYHGEFVEFMDKLLADTPMASPADAFDQFKIDIAAENALAAH